VDSASSLFGAGEILWLSRKDLAMTTILILNAASSLVALLGVAGFFAHRERRARVRPAVQLLYVTRVNPSKLPRR